MDKEVETIVDACVAAGLPVPDHVWPCRVGEGGGTLASVEPLVYAVAPARSTTT